MSIKPLATVLIILGITIAVFEGLPNKAWQWFEHTPAGVQLLGFVSDNQNLSGLLRGPLDSLGSSNLTASGIITWTNTQRETQGLVPLHENALLRKAAEAKVDDMFAQQYFEHKSPDGKSPADIIHAAGYDYIVVGENLALGNFKDDETLVQAWMDSPGHRANILNGKYQEIGTAAKKGMFEGKEVWLAVQEFGAPLSACPTLNTNLKPQIDANRTQLAENQAELQRQKAALSANRYKSQDDYNAAVAKYNALVDQTNKLSDATQAMVTDYNAAVNNFNKCLETNS
ncbi:MAG TPA: CAP domain-containing protein [Patescibacteria group bacterium]|jgi:hypothetical protein|nr:CAP domain-containing protein [Patescibacteria group bacterium]